MFEGFRDFLLKPEILRAIGDCGFEHPSEVQHECIPQVERTLYIWPTCNCGDEKFKFYEYFQSFSRITFCV